jgi:Fe-S-cluster-containing dehydrogenase component
MYQDRLFLDETGCVLNEKMMPDATAMVPDRTSKLLRNYGKSMISGENVVVPRYYIIIMTGKHCHISACLFACTIGATHYDLDR